MSTKLVTLIRKDMFYCFNSRCQVSLHNPKCMELLCETDECFMDGDLYERLEDEYYRGGIRWKPKNNTVFWGHTVEEIANKRLGTRLPEEQDKKVRHVPVFT
jgi:hypothetical protein